MNKSALRSFSAWARRYLISNICDRAQFIGVTEDKVVSMQAKSATDFMVNGVTFEFSPLSREHFVDYIKEVGWENAIEEIAYTWFNRILAIRFMEVNGYLENGTNGENIYVIGSVDSGRKFPDAVARATELKYVDKDVVYKYQDAEDNTGLFRYILMRQCAELSKWMPDVFETVSDYTDLLLPETLLFPDGLIDHLTHDLNADDFNISAEGNGQVEIFGWMYQFYIAEKKKAVEESKNKINKGTLPAKTQLFTPDWIVRYMVENSLGKIWVTSHDESNLKDDMKYYLEPNISDKEVVRIQEELKKYYQVASIRDIKFLDPCCGSGHVLVYAFDLFYRMYLEEGYTADMIPSIILENNIYGLDVDKRAIQLTSFALTMKARSYNKNLFKDGYHFPNVIDVHESNTITETVIGTVAKLLKISAGDKDVINECVFRFRNAECYGSLIDDFEYESDIYRDLYKKISDKEDAVDYGDVFEVETFKKYYGLICVLLRQAQYMSTHYDCVVTNPPYLPTSSCEEYVKEYASLNYPNSKTDMFAMFIERCREYINQKGIIGMITMHSWMFLDSYADLRSDLIKNSWIESLIHLGARAFEDISGEVVQTCAFCMRKNKKDALGEYFRLVKSKNPFEKEELFLKRENRYIVDQDKFNIIPGDAFAYWWSDKMLDCFNNGKQIDGLPMKGIQTGKGEKYLKIWFEVEKNKSGFNLSSHEDMVASGKKWFPLTSGGNVRRWYGNFWNVVNLENDGKDIRSTGLKNFRLKDPKYYFLEGFTWTEVTTKPFACRYLPPTILFGNGGPVCFKSKNLLYLMGLMNSAVAREIFTVLAPTINCGPDQVRNFPYIEESIPIIEEMVNENIEIGKNDWDAYETSMDFSKHPLL